MCLGILESITMQFIPIHCSDSSVVMSQVHLVKSHYTLQYLAG